MTPDEFKTLAGDYAALRAPSELNDRVRAQQRAITGPRRGARYRPVLALAAGVIGAALIAVWLNPERATVQTAQTPRGRVSTAIPSLSSLSVARPKIDASARRTPPSSALRTPPRPPTPKRSKEKRNVQS